MFGLFTTIFCFIRKPRESYRQRIKLPIITFVHDTIDLYSSRTKAGVKGVKDIIFRGSLVSFVTSLLVWLSIFMYLAFYYAYVPAITHEKPIYLTFKPCQPYQHEKGGMCSFPSAHVQLTKRQQLLMLGQPYKIQIDLEMPESPANKKLGMFMVCVDFRGRDGKLLADSCRSTMLHYRSSLLETMYTIFFSPLFLLGSAEEKQHISVELFSNYEEQENQPVTDVYIEIQSRHIEVYSARFLINAHFSGLRYLMFNWPVLSAAIGITSNLFFIAVVCMVSWYHLIHSEEYKKLVLEREKNRYFERNVDEFSSSSNEDASLLEDIEDKTGTDYFEDIIQKSQ